MPSGVYKHKPNQGFKKGHKNNCGHWIHWANISGLYKRDPSDWVRLCALCHKRWDAGLLELKNKKI